MSQETNPFKQRPDAYSTSTLNFTEKMGNEFMLFKVNFSQKTDKYFYMRLTTFGLIMAFLIIIRNSNSLPPNFLCILDYGHNKLQYFNNLVNNDLYWRQFFQVSSSALMDIMCLTTFIYWFFRKSNCRMFMSLAIFYGTRAVFQIFFKLTYPEGYLWPDPGVTSLVVPYGQTSDFFYSGHVGFLLLCTLEHRANKVMYMSYLAIIVNIYMIFVMLLFRVHYTFDIIFGLIFAHYTFKIASNNLELFNRFWTNFYIEMGNIVCSIIDKIRCTIYGEQQLLQNHV